jgi:hypothetical protein
LECGFLLFAHGTFASLWRIIRRIGLTNLYNRAKIIVKKKMIGVHLKNILNWCYQLSRMIFPQQLQR